MTHKISCQFDWQAGHAPKKVVGNRLETNYVDMLLRSNRTKTEWWYEASCCGQRQTSNNMSIREDDWKLLWALEHWDSLVKVASERGMLQMGLTPTAATATMLA